MNTIKCSKCEKIIGELIPGSSWIKGNVVVCGRCYEKHVQTHKTKIKKSNKAENK